MTRTPEEQPFEPIRDEAALDGNAAAGILAAAMGRDISAEEGRCRHCGTANAVGALRAYLGGPGTVLRCPACSGVVVVIVERSGRTTVHASDWH